MIPPALVKPRAMEGTGFLGQAADDVYRVDGRGPVPRRHLGGAARGVPLRRDPRRRRAAAALRRRSARASARRPARTARTPRGIIRVHWFDKVEMFSYTTLEDAEAEHQRLLGWEKEFLAKLELRLPRDRHRGRRPRPVARSASSTARPGSRPRASTASSPRPRTAPTSRPAGSTSAGRFDGRRRSRSPPSTAPWSRSRAPSSRSCETHQQADGSVRVPAALQPYLQGRDRAGAGADR